MDQDSQNKFGQLIAESAADDNIIGMFLGGSRGKGFENDGSDYDIRLVVKDEVIFEYGQKYPKYFSPGIDIAVMSFSEFQNYARWGSDTAWDRYEFVRAKALVDKNGMIQNLIDEKGCLPQEIAKKYIEEQLDAYLNCFIRSVESYAKNNITGVRLLAALSLPCLLNAVFAAEDRLAPFADYLEKELDRYPLKKFPLSSRDLIFSIFKILDSGDVPAQRALEIVIERYFRDIGFGQVFDGWGGRLPRAISEK